MIPSPTERDELFKRFARALFRGDMDALFERYSFADGWHATKDVYRKPL